jgi:type IV fimbrial biogenesis protein FimT
MVKLREQVDSETGNELLMMRSHGFSLVELMVAVALLGLMLSLAMPSFGVWVSNAKVRTSSDALQSGLRLAQAEAVRRQRQMVFFRTTDPACTEATVPSASGNFWAMRSVSRTAGEPVQTVQCGQLGEASEGVTIEGPTALCFSGIGRQVANANPGIGSTPCVLPANGRSEFDVRHLAGDRQLRVVVDLAGSVRMCDPARSLSTTQPDGCP